MKHIRTALMIIVGITVLFLLVRFGGMSILPELASGVRVASEGVPESSELVGGRAPHFDLPDTTGDHRALSDFTDTPLVIVFWATSNEASADQIKILDDYLAHQSPGQRFAEIIGIASGEESSVVMSFMRRGGYEITTLIDQSGVITESYEIKSLPTFYFIDREGSIRGRFAGVLSEQAIGDKLEALLK